MTKKIGSEECDAAFVLMFFLNTLLVNISLPILFHFLYCFYFRSILFLTFVCIFCY